ncbi:MAG: acyclic terpene utilization AtuA family protein [Gemmataceae bacterium]
MTTKHIRIGNAGGFWGDNQDAPVQLAEQGRLDYLTIEYLAELTMSILALLRSRDPNAGYATDFVDLLPRLAPILKLQPKLKLVTNAGGMNPRSCALAAAAALAQAGCPRKVAMVSGDDLLPQLDELLAAGHLFRHLDSDEPLEAIRSKVVSVNAYLGAAPIVAALAAGAEVVVTGRVADASLVVGPLMHEFGWNWNDVARLSAATVAGHLLECGAQATGGLWINATEATQLGRVGYPIAECEPDGTFRVTKPAGTGGAVNLETITEQLLYEVADPARYYTPDVVADFTTPRFRQVAPDVVEVRDANGTPATDNYKVSIAYRDGFTSSGMLVIFGPNAPAKGRLCGQIVLEKLRQAGHTYADSLVETLGAGSCVPGVVNAEVDPPEVVLRVAVRDGDKKAVERFTKEFAPLVTSGLPGVTGYTTGRPTVREVFAYWPALVAKSAVKPHWELLPG